MMKTLFKIAGIIILLIATCLVIWIFSNMRDRNTGYKADLKIIATHTSILKAGFSAEKITPDVPDKWDDIDGDATFEPEDGETYTDGNGNGEFDPVWIAGFGNSRAAVGIHDDLWARTMVLDDGITRLAIVVLDAIGFMNNEVIDVRERIPADAGITYTMVVSTHDHEAPDLLGLWGKTPFKSGVSSEYIEYIKKQIIRSVNKAVSELKPAIMEISADMAGGGTLVKDTRMPEVFDSGLRILRFADSEDGKTLGTLISWSDHPETLWGKNLFISSDFPNFLREGIEKGVFDKGIQVRPGQGGTAIYINGALGGLMTTHPSIAVKDPFTGEEFTEPTFEKAEAQGNKLALLALSAMEHPVEKIDSAGISLVVRTISLPIDNKLFRLGTMAGVINRGMSGWMKMRSEISVGTIGPVSFATFPGEPYPELVNGNIEAPEGQDYKTEPLEIPAVREMMPGKYKFIFGLANDEIGYIIPKSQWDEEAPYTYGNDNAPYGEENSLGPETAVILHSNIREMLNDIKAVNP